MNVGFDTINEADRVREELIEQFSSNSEFIDFEIAPMMGMDDDDKAKLINDMYNSIVNYSNEERMRRNSLLGRMNPIMDSFITGIPVRPLYSFCYAHENKLIFDPYGNVYTCLVAVGRDDMAVGTYFPDVMFKENSIYKRNIDSIPTCKDCNYVFLCGGGCPMKLKTNDDFFKPHCDSIKVILHTLLPKLYMENIKF